MTWWAIDVRTTPEERDRLGAWLVARTGQAVEERDDGTLVTFAPDEREADLLIAELGRAAGASAATSRRRVEPVDWSTRLALALLERLVRPGDLVLDLGSGSGILAIAAVKLGAARAVGIEQDAEANLVAARNAERNGVAGAVEFLEGEAGDLAPLLGPADLALSNILRSVNTALLPALAQALRPGGIAVFAGMEAAEAPLFLPTLGPAGFTVLEELADTGWWGVAARRR